VEIVYLAPDKPTGTLTRQRHAPSVVQRRALVTDYLEPLQALGITDPAGLADLDDEWPTPSAPTTNPRALAAKVEAGDLDPQDAAVALVDADSPEIHRARRKLGMEHRRRLHAAKLTALRDAAPEVHDQLAEVAADALTRPADRTAEERYYAAARLAGTLRRWGMLDTAEGAAGRCYLMRRPDAAFRWQDDRAGNRRAATTLLDTGAQRWIVPQPRDTPRLDFATIVGLGDEVGPGLFTAAEVIANAAEWQAVREARDDRGRVVRDLVPDPR